MWIEAKNSQIQSTNDKKFQINMTMYEKMRQKDKIFGPFKLTVLFQSQWIGILNVLG